MRLVFLSDFILRTQLKVGIPFRLRLKVGIPFSLRLKVEPATHPSP